MIATDPDKKHHRTAQWQINHFCQHFCVFQTICFVSYPVSDLAPGQMGIDDMKMLEQKAQQLAAEAEQDKPKPKEKILFVRFVFLFHFRKNICAKLCLL